MGHAGGLDAVHAGDLDVLEVSTFLLLEISTSLLREVSTFILLEFATTALAGGLDVLEVSTLLLLEVSALLTLEFSTCGRPRRAAGLDHLRATHLGDCHAKVLDFLMRQTWIPYCSKSSCSASRPQLRPGGWPPPPMS